MAGKSIRIRDWAAQYGLQNKDVIAALDAFGVRTGLLAITRADLADPAPALAEAVAQVLMEDMKGRT